MKFYRIIMVAIAVFSLIFVLTAMANTQTKEQPTVNTCFSDNATAYDALAVRPVIPDEPVRANTNNKKTRSTAQFKEIGDFQKALAPVQDAARSGDNQSVRRSVNTLSQRSNALNQCRLPDNQKARNFIKARKALQKSVKDLSKSCQKGSNEKVISDLNTVQVKFQELRATID